MVETRHAWLSEKEQIRTRVKLAEEYLQIIEEKSMGLVSMNDFEKMSFDDEPRRFIFCLDHPKGRMNELGEECGLYEWDRGIVELGIDRSLSFSEMITEYMKEVDNSGRQIVFLLPPDVTNHDKSNVTRFEFVSLMSPENREGLNKCLFVFDDQFED